MTGVNPANPSVDAGQDDVALIVLAAGQGTRMASTVPKPLHPIAGMPMVRHVLRAGAGARPTTTVLVVGQETRDLADRLELATPVTTVIQHPPRGTGDALRPALGVVGDVAWLVVLFADHPLLTETVVADLLAGARAARARVTILTARLPDPAGYARIERDDRGRPVRIVERKDDDPAHRAGPLEINSGMMALDAAWAREAVTRIAPSPATGEVYLTDLVALAVADAASGDNNWPVATVEGEPTVALGINDRTELAAADAIARERTRQRLLDAGVSLVGPATIFVDEDVEIGPDTTILPFSFLSAGTTIGARCRIGPHAVIARGRIADDVVVQSSTVEDSSIARGRMSVRTRTSAVAPRSDRGCTSATTRS